MKGLLGYHFVAATRDRSLFDLGQCFVGVPERAGTVAVG